MSGRPSGTLAVVVERDLAHSPEKIWRALTRSHLMEEWLMKNDFELEQGRRFSVGADWGAVDCQVQAIEPLKSLTYSWDTKDLKSSVTWTLTPTATGTHLRMEQSGFRPDQQPYYRGATVGWRNMFARLEALLARTD